MNISGDIVNDPYYKFCRRLFEGLDSETLKLAVSDRAKTSEYVKSSLEKQRPEKMNDMEYIESLVDEMQKVAREILEKRS